MDARSPEAQRMDPAGALPRSAAELFVEQLHRSGVDFFFNTGGTDFPPIAEAFARARAEGAPTPRPVVVPHENLAVAMAHGVHMVSGRPRAVKVHVNVGTANTINATLDASREHTPVLFYAGRSPYSEAGRNGARRLLMTRASWILAAARAGTPPPEPPAAAQPDGCGRPG